MLEVEKEEELEELGFAELACSFCEECNSLAKLLSLARDQHDFSAHVTSSDQRPPRRAGRYASL